MSQSGDVWREQLAQWAIPTEILEQAPESPWIHPPALFQIPAEIELSPSHQRAREVHPQSFLDIGCGGGIAAFATDAPLVIGVDHQQEMLDMFSRNAIERGRESETFLGFWPDIAKAVPDADLVAAHHVVYNVQKIEEFLSAMDSHSEKRVVIEMPQRHPLSSTSDAWKHFWNLERPTTPTPDDLMAVIRELGFSPHIELWEGTMRSWMDIDSEVEHTRIRLCLPSSRDQEIREYLLRSEAPKVRKLATIWWDKE